ncbi:MAG: peptidoglycan-binding protein, partial [Patescibacteria group bacterium]|nr:peptidoglycan-binding protein [Patescibacteria group bacterium]
MKRILSVAGVAVLALALVAGAQAYSFQTNLTVGSTGADVVQLQTVLMSMGYDIPAISSGAAAKGYFGSQTTAAVKQYQAAHGIPNTGFVGPMTREALNSGATTGTTGTTGGSSVSACGAGMTSVSYQGTSYCLPPVLALLVQQQLGGAVTTPTTPAQGTISTVGVPGTLTTSLWSSPGNGTVVYKGQSYDIVAAKLQASASDMAVQSISFDFSDRLWLYASTITLKDDTGAVIGQVNNLNAS